jgi:hypothetical protein
MTNMTKAQRTIVRLGGIMLAVGFSLTPLWTPAIFIFMAGFSILIIAMVWTL